MMALADYARLIESALVERLGPDYESVPDDYQAPPYLTQAMRYSLMAGGKRLRPAMLLATVDMLGGDRDAAMAAACAIEMIHTYSLIHDDLPGMDNDTIRRVRPTNHVVYGEGQAILAGDALLNRAYELMLENALKYPNTVGHHVRAMSEIAWASGMRGMVGGQSIDLLSEQGHVPHDERTLAYIHVSKTSCLFIGAIRAGAQLAGADEASLDAVTRYARAFGLMFQAADDLLDVEGESAALGKSVGKDAREGKLTAVSLFGVDGAHARVDRLFTDGQAALEPFGARAEFFQTLIASMRGRKA